MHERARRNSTSAQRHWVPFSGFNAERAQLIEQPCGGAVGLRLKEVSFAHVSLGDGRDAAAAGLFLDCERSDAHHQRYHQRCGKISPGRAGLFSNSERRKGHARLLLSLHQGKRVPSGQYRSFAIGRQAEQTIERCSGRRKARCSEGQSRSSRRNSVIALLTMCGQTASNATPAKGTIVLEGAELPYAIA